MTPYYQDGTVTIYHGDALEILPTLPIAQLVVADPPYNGVLADAWDNQWASDESFLDWTGGWVAALPIAENGSLYVFCTPRLHGRIEAIVAARYRVIGSLVWDKNGTRQGAAGSGIDVTALRTYWHAGTERVVFAEAASGDDIAKRESGYWDAIEGTKRAVVGDYLRAEFQRAGVTQGEIAALFPSKSGGLTGCVSNWLLGYNLPTEEQYEAMRARLNSRPDDAYLRREYAYLRREYDDLRREYDDLRRPFFLTPRRQWGDVLRFDPPRNRRHPAEKPIGLIGQLVDVSSRPNDLVLDPFMGSGTTLEAARLLGRRAIGIEVDERYCEMAATRCSQEVLGLSA